VVLDVTGSNPVARPIFPFSIFHRDRVPVAGVPGRPFGCGVIAGVVLAGGGATRMGGGDKPLLPLGDSTILDFVLARLRPQVGALAISANGDPARFARFGLPVLADAPGHAGPLAGVAAALAWSVAAGADAVLTVPGDTPFIPGDLAARLGAAPAWAESGGAVHPLVALWPASAAALLAAWLDGGGDLRVRRFGESLGMRTVSFAETEDPFCNINTPSDLAAAQIRAAGLPAG
jgi:molybdenum cofactor guanylyltransferase